MSRRYIPLCVLAVWLVILSPEPAASVATRTVVEDSLVVSDELGPELELPYGVATAYMIGSTLLQQGDTAGALPYLAHANRISPDEDEFAITYRDALVSLGYLREALRISGSLVERNPDFFTDWMQHLSLLVALEQYDEALANIEDCRIQHPDSVQLGLMRAEILMRAHDWDASLEAYRKQLPVLPGEREQIYLAMAEIAVHIQRHDQADSIWAEGLAALPESRPLRLGAIQHLVAQDKDAQAMSVAVSGDSVDTGGVDRLDSSWVRTAAGLISGEGRGINAARLLRPRFENDLLDLETSLLLGRIQAGLEQWGRAIAIATLTAERWPESPLPQMFIGEFKAANGDHFGGEQHVRRAIEMDPDSADYLLSLISIMSRRHPLAFEQGERLPQDDPLRQEIVSLAAQAQSLLTVDDPAASHMMVGATFQAMGDHEAAIPSYIIAALEPLIAKEARLNLSLAYEHIGRRDEALAILEDLATLHGDDPIVLNALGYTLADRNTQLDRAEQLIRAALEQNPDNPAFLDSLGWLFYRQGVFTDSLDYLVRAANVMPEDPEILEHLGMVLIELERYDRALEILKRAMALGGDKAVLEPVIEELEPLEP